MNVDKLEGAELDAAVARAAGLFIYGMERMPASEGGATFVTLIGDGRSPNLLGQPEIWTPSRSWAHGGPIIEREQISLTSADFMPRPGLEWGAEIPGTLSGEFVHARSTGRTPLIAAMRAYIASSQGKD